MDIISDSHLHFEFDKLLILDSFNKLKLESIIMEDEFFGSFKDYLNNHDHSSFEMSKDEFIEEFNSFFSRDFFDQYQDNLFIFYYPKNLKSISIINQQFHLENNEIDKKLTKFDREIISGNIIQNINTIKVCQKQVIYQMRIDPENIRAGINGFIRESKYIWIVSNPECQEQDVDIQKIVKEITFSFFGIILLNLFREIIFSFLNNKDVLDLIKYDHIPEDENMNKIEKVFTTFDCRRYQSIYEEYKSFQSNIFIKSLFIKDFEQTLESKIYESHSLDWLQEYKKQNFKIFPMAIQGQLFCRYTMITPEYISLSMMVLFLCLNVLFFVFLCCLKCKKNKKLIKLLLFVNLCKRKMKNIFLTSLFFVYFYNLISFLSLIKLTKTLIFGLVDFTILIVRAYFIIYPILSFIDKEKSEKTKKKKSNQKKEENKMTSKKESKVNLFTKIYRNHTVYGTWSKVKNKVTTYLRIVPMIKNLISKKIQNKEKLVKYEVYLNTNEIQFRKQRKKIKQNGEINF
jgi:hypothetical protein